ncbi:hypothetical protein BKA62DRAFT_704734 [Auriculariales sp. MPI-PUGE-AT-0066]|nr:hypothetical protein BKA62DRAFT_704734 [Auriculariales sp. MPI-PUGE-AT-0066]
MKALFRISAALISIVASSRVVDGRLAARLALRHLQPQLLFNCDVSDLKVPVPAGQANLTIPTDQKIRFVTVGVGVQNYTCADTGKYATAGAVASLYDVSCITKLPLFTDIQINLFNALTTNDSRAVVDQLLLAATLKLADHYFITEPPATAIIPFFDFRAALKDDDEYVAAPKKAGITSPDGAENIDWTQLAAINGTAASTVFRVHTHLGQPPSSCLAGETISAPYAAQYWFYQTPADDDGGDGDDDDDRIQPDVTST